MIRITFFGVLSRLLVIAQEVEKIVPKVVQTETDGLKTIAYDNLIGLLMEAAKDLKQCKFS